MPTPADSIRPASLGMRVFIAADAVTFAALIASALIARAGDWRAPGDPPVSVGYGLLLTGLLAGASALLIAGRRARQTRPAASPKRVRATSHLAAAACGLGFVVLALLEWRGLAAAGLAPGNSRFADFFFVITGYHMMHVAAGVGALLWPVERPGAVAVAWYWHFVDAVWIAIFATLYL